jgi:hypothetical protein
MSITTSPAPSPGDGAFVVPGDLDAIAAALHDRYPLQGDTAVRTASLRVHFNLESFGQVTPADRMRLAAPHDRGAVDVLIDRTLEDIAARNASRVHCFATPIPCLTGDTFAVPITK